MKTKLIVGLICLSTSAISLAEDCSVAVDLTPQWMADEIGTLLHNRGYDVGTSTTSARYSVRLGSVAERAYWSERCPAELVISSGAYRYQCAIDESLTEFNRMTVTRFGIEVFEGETSVAQKLTNVTLLPMSKDSRLLEHRNLIELNNESSLRTIDLEKLLDQVNLKGCR